MEKNVNKKYRMHSVFMFIFSGINILSTILLLNVMCTIFVLGHLGVDYNLPQTLCGGQRERIVFYVLITSCLLGIIAWVKIRSGMLLRKESLKPKLSYILFGIINICEAIAWAVIIVLVDMKVGKRVSVMAAMSTKIHLLGWLWFFVCLGGISILVMGGTILLKRVKEAHKLEQAISPSVPYNKMCTIGLVVSCISLFLNLWGFVGLAGTILSIIGLISRSKRNERGKAQAIVGIVIGVCSIIYAFIIIFLIVKR